MQKVWANEFLMLISLNVVAFQSFSGSQPAAPRLVPPPSLSEKGLMVRVTEDYALAIDGAFLTKKQLLREIMA